MLAASTIQLLRIHFSFFLMPVYWFALSQLTDINYTDAILIFIILHVLVYPASNGYNSFMDRDTGSIGGIKSPMQPTRQLFYVSMVLDVGAIISSFLVSLHFALGIAAYIAVSRLYSYRGVRLKKYPIIGYLSVVLFQGAVTFWLVYHGASNNKTTDVPVIPMLVASLLIGGFYPLTQIYQHDADRRDGVTTLSYLLGYRGTFLYSGLLYTVAFTLLGWYFLAGLQATAFYVIFIIMVPVLIFFFIWAYKVWQNVNEANFKNAMQMNMIAAVCTNAAFITTLILKQF